MKKEDITITYEQDYCPRLDVTIIMEYIRKGDDLLQQRVSGFYYGQPDLDGLIEFKEDNKIILKKESE